MRIPFRPLLVAIHTYIKGHPGITLIKALFQPCCESHHCTPQQFSLVSAQPSHHNNHITAHHNTPQQYVYIYIYIYITHSSSVTLWWYGVYMHTLYLSVSSAMVCIYTHSPSASMVLLYVQTYYLPFPSWCIYTLSLSLFICSVCVHNLSLSILACISTLSLFL